MFFAHCSKPKAVHIDVTYLCYSRTIEDPLGSRRVELEGNPDVRTRVHAEGLDSEALIRPSDDSVELRLCRAFSNDRLGLRPGFDAMLADADTASRRTLSGSSAACPISICPHNDLRLLALQRESPNEPGVALEGGPCQSSLVYEEILLWASSSRGILP